MRFKMNAKVLVFSLKGNLVFTFEYEYQWEVPQSQLNKHIEGLESTAKMIFQFSANRAVEEDLLVCKEHRYAVERDIPNATPGDFITENQPSHNGCYLLRFDNFKVEQVQDQLINQS